MTSADADRKTCGHTFYGKVCAECRAANLTADLAAARAQLAKVRHDRDEMIRVHDEVEAERDALRGEIKRTKAELNGTMRALRKQAAKHQRRQREMASERDAAQAELAASRSTAFKEAAALARIPQGHYQVGMKKLPWWDGETMAEAILALATKVKP